MRPTTSAAWLHVPSWMAASRSRRWPSCPARPRPSASSFPPSSISSRCCIRSAGSRSAIVRQPRPPAAAPWCAARRWSVPAASPAIRSEIIDDCALARRLKGQGPIWLGLTRRATSLRPYGGFLKIGRMISRSAYAQLGYSPLVLAGTVAAMGLVYIAPPLLALLSDGPARWLGLCAWLVMAHHLPADAALLPPVAALGAGASCHRRRLCASSPCSRRSTSGAAAAACGRAASRPWRETRDRRGRLRLRQGAPGREFPGGLAAGARRVAADDPRLLPLRARGRRCRRPRIRLARPQAGRARTPGGGLARRDRRQRRRRKRCAWLCRRGA